MDNFAQRLKTARAASGMTQEQAARTADVGLDSWRSWEQGRTEPRLENLGKIAAALGCTTCTLLPDPPALPAPPDQPA